MTYKALILCPNCGQTHWFMVEDGIYVHEHLRIISEKCSNCNMRISKVDFKPKGL